MPISVPRLYRNRFGVYYLRLLIPKRLKAEYGRGEFRRSLHTKDAHSAKLLALQWNIQWEEQRVSKPRLSDFARLTQGNVSVRKYEIDIQKGTLKTDGPEDHRNAMEALEAMKTLASAQSRAPVGLPWRQARKRPTPLSSPLPRKFLTRGTPTKPKSKWLAASGTRLSATHEMP